MAMTTKDRLVIRAELESQGYSTDYVDKAPPKITLYRHKTQLNPQGEVVSEAGTAVSGLPGQPSYVRDKARQGLLAWPPSDSCTCRWCSERKSESEPKGTGKRTMGPHFNSQV